MGIWVSVEVLVILTLCFPRRGCSLLSRAQTEADPHFGGRKELELILEGNLLLRLHFVWERFPSRLRET
jgi:hypothetical protein